MESVQGIHLDTAYQMTNAEKELRTLQGGGMES